MGDAADSSTWLASWWRNIPLAWRYPTSEDKSTLSEAPPPSSDGCEQTSWTISSSGEEWHKRGVLAAKTLQQPSVLRCATRHSRAYWPSRLGNSARRLRSTPSDATFASDPSILHRPSRPAVTWSWSWSRDAQDPASCAMSLTSKSCCLPVDASQSRPSSSRNTIGTTVSSGAASDIPVMNSMSSKSVCSISMHSSRPRPWPSPGSSAQYPCR